MSLLAKLGKCRLRILLAVMIALAVAKSISFSQVYALESELKDIAELHAGHLEHGLLKGAARAVGSEVVASPSYGLAPKTVGKVTIYIQPIGDSASSQLYVYDFFYYRDKNAWKLSESGVCVHRDSHELGSTLRKTK